ncbi:hypothetical protein B7494_g4792 [Chlorociboria aeruginascens]|nr:hypothetical protein B7494_g4792 [Chlorociboria aeruginascens]
MSTIGCVKQVLQSTFISGCQFNNGRSYRIFYQSPDGAIHAFFTDNFGAQWGGGDQQVMVGKDNPMMQTPLSTVMFTDSKGQACSRTFYLGKNHDVRVFGVTGGRAFDGRVNKGEFIAADYSRVGAIAWTAGGHVHLRVYYQATDDHIQEICFDGDRGDTYTKGHAFPTPLKGTALAFICIPPKSGGGPVLKGYYQHSDLRIMEIIWDGSWHAGTFINGNCAVAAQSHISACISSLGQISVYWTNHCGSFNSVTECHDRTLNGL